jgi:hypothetical protein
VEAAKTQIKAAAEYMDLIAKVDEGVLIKQLEGYRKKAFIIFTMDLPMCHYAKSEQYKDRGAFFKSEQFVIVGIKCSYIIEHGFC